MVYEIRNMHLVGCFQRIGSSLKLSREDSMVRVERTAICCQVIGAPKTGTLFASVCLVEEVDN